MEIRLNHRFAYRRSGRVSLAILMEASGIDPVGNQFSDMTRTDTVSRYGCCLSLPRLLPSNHQIALRRVDTQQRVIGRVVAQMGLNGNGYLHGIGVRQSCEGLWGISFSALFYDRILDNLRDGVYFVNRDRKITYWNKGAERLTGYIPTEAVGGHCLSSLACVDEAGKSLCVKGCPLAGVLVDGQPRQAESYVRHKNGHRVPVNVRVTAFRNSVGEIVGAVKVFSDATERRQTEKRVSELETLAFRDPLTNLPNRRYMELKVAQALQDHHEFSRAYGLLLLDLDRFKNINDKYGHDVGDAVLKAIAGTLVQSLRTADLVGRWGGEEFLAVVPDVHAIDLGDLAERCRVMIAQSGVAHDVGRVSVTASIGATLLNQTDVPEAAIRRADELMYQSKSSGGNLTTAG